MFSVDSGCFPEKTSALLTMAANTIKNSKRLPTYLPYPTVTQVENQSVDIKRLKYVGKKL